MLNNKESPDYSTYMSATIKQEEHGARDGTPLEVKAADKFFHNMFKKVFIIHEAIILSNTLLCEIHEHHVVLLRNV
jgi:hypothetical protein